MNKKIWFIVFLAVGILIGVWAGRTTIPYKHPIEPKTAEMEKPENASQPKTSFWTCSMHPQIKQPKPGKCPICFMDLILVYEEGETEARLPVITLSERARELAEIRTSAVSAMPIEVNISMVGKIDYDETRFADVSAWVGGRIDKLFVNFTGVEVKKNDHLVYIYSPELVTAQQEYLLAYKRWKSDASFALPLLDSARKKLELWGILPEQIEKLEQTGKISEHMMIHAPIGGTVIGKDAFEGKYVSMGDKLYTIADLSLVWALLDAYELDVGWLHYGQTVQFETEAYPGEIFKGRISFIGPFLDEATRTVKIRVNVQNKEGKLKPGMFVRAKVIARIPNNGKVYEPPVAGKWICPMHQEIIKDTEDRCDICGMGLVSSEEIGFLPALPKETILSVPASSVLLTGKRSLVYVEEEKDGKVFYVARHIRIGPRAGDNYVVIDGLKEGEKVVTRGNFKIDASLQILGKPSMMSPEEENIEQMKERRHE